MIDVNKRPFDTWEDFNLILKLLADIMGLPERSAFVHDDVHFNKIILKIV